MKVISISTDGTASVTEFVPVKMLEAETFWRDCLDDPSVLIATVLIRSTHGAWETVKTFCR